MNQPLPQIFETERLKVAGAHFGARGTHTARTMMLEELTELLLVVRGGEKSDYVTAVVEENALSKDTYSNRKLTMQRLSELYGLDPRIPMFTVIRRLWDLDPIGRPLIALLASLARDPLLRSTAPYVLSLDIGAEVSHRAFEDGVRAHVDARLNDSILDKVRRNSCSTWTQSGHLEGRVRKCRRRVDASFGPVAFALWLGFLEGRIADELLGSFWMRVFDAPRHRLFDAVTHAKQAGLIFASIGGGVVQIDASPVFTPRAEGAR